MEHAQSVDLRKQLAEQRRLLKERKDDYCDKATMVFWLFFAVTVYFFLDYHATHASKDICSYVGHLMPKSLPQFLTSWRISYPLMLFANLASSWTFGSTTCQTDDSGGCVDGFCVLGLTAAVISMLFLLFLNVITERHTRVYLNGATGLVLLWKMWESEANRAIVKHIGFLALLKFGFLVVVWSVVDTQYNKESAEVVKDARHTFHRHVKAICFLYFLTCLHLFYIIKYGEFA